MTSSKRQRELARRRAERQAARRAEAARKQRRRSIISWSVGLVVLALLVTVPLVQALTKDDSDGPSAAPTPTESSAPEPTSTPDPVDERPVACGGKEPAAVKPQKFDKAPPMTIDPKKKYVATIKTSCGDVVVDLLADKAPTTVNSFVFLAGKKYFDGTRCHRTLSEGSFIAQCGDPTATGSGGPGYQFKDENLPKDAKPPYPAGTLAMANSGPNTNGSQFFFVVKESGFPPNYTVFGKVTKGLDVLEKLIEPGDDGTMSAGGGEPNERIFIESFTVKAS